MMPVRMLLVRILRGRGHGNQADDVGRPVKSGMGAIGNHAQGMTQGAENQLGRRHQPVQQENDDENAADPACAGRVHRVILMNLAGNALEIQVGMHPKGPRAKADPERSLGNPDPVSGFRVNST